MNIIATVTGAATGFLASRVAADIIDGSFKYSQPVERVGASGVATWVAWEADNGGDGFWGDFKEAAFWGSAVNLGAETLRAVTQTDLLPIHFNGSGISVSDADFNLDTLLRPPGRQVKKRDDEFDGSALFRAPQHRTTRVGKRDDMGVIDNSPDGDFNSDAFARRPLFRNPIFGHRDTDSTGNSDGCACPGAGPSGGTIIS